MIDGDHDEGFAMRDVPATVGALTDEEIEAQIEAEEQAMAERMKSGKILDWPDDALVPLTDEQRELLARRASIFRRRLKRIDPELLKRYDEMVKRAKAQH
jgi:hypothetical protein